MSRGNFYPAATRCLTGPVIFFSLTEAPLPDPTPTPPNTPNGPDTDPKHTRNGAKRSRNGPKSSLSGWDGRGVCRGRGGGGVVGKRKSLHWALWAGKVCVYIFWPLRESIFATRHQDVSQGPLGRQPGSPKKMVFILSWGPRVVRGLLGTDPRTPPSDPPRPPLLEGRTGIDSASIRHRFPDLTLFRC